MFRVGQQFDPQFGLFQRALAIAIKGDAAFVGFERIVQALFALFHLADQLLELIERFFEVGDAVGCGRLCRLGIGRFAIGLAHGAHATAAARRNQSGNQSACVPPRRLAWSQSR
jgi:hypothetical protein